MEPEEKKTRGNESHEKETKRIYASAANLSHIRIGNINWCKCGHSQNEAREIVFAAERWIQFLLLRLKSQSTREASRHPAFMCNSRIISSGQNKF